MKTIEYYRHFKLSDCFCKANMPWQGISKNSLCEKFFPLKNIPLLSSTKCFAMIVQGVILVKWIDVYIGRIERACKE